MMPPAATNREGESVNDTVKYVLEESRIPRVWYNLQADLPQPLPDPLKHRNTTSRLMVTS